ncbi:MAG: sulfotransferase family protein [Cyanobacteria bacterium K_DeepCast_0m_m1_088]|nr:sulfotransferase family protein [Cyanobacteria bacterium K_DeepCast_0m_m1_088]
MTSSASTASASTATASTTTASTTTVDEHFILFETIPLIYARVPKVANSSVKASLSKLLELPPDDDCRTTADATWRRGTHGQTRMVNVFDARRRRSSHFIFSFVRNPFDRLVSAYNNKLLENDHLSPAMERMGLERHMPFDRFLDVVADTADADLDVHLLPQSTILCIDGLPIPSFIGKLEAMDNHWQRLQRSMHQAGLPAVGNLPRKNVRRTDVSDLPAYFNSRSRIDLAAHRYADDLALFYGDCEPGQLACGEPEANPAPIEPAGSNGHAPT